MPSHTSYEEAVARGWRSLSRATDLARDALKVGPLTRPVNSGPYVSGAKQFASKTINTLIESGEAVRCGSGVVHIDHVRQLRQSAEKGAHP